LFVKDIRTSVFTNEQKANANEEFDSFDSDENTNYALVYQGDTPVATGRIAHYGKNVKIGRIAVAKSQRGKGLGAILVNALVEKSKQLGADEIFVDSQLHAVEFYKKLGFEKISDEIIIDRGIEHLPMKLKV
jgi:hypothetical protein